MLKLLFRRYGTYVTDKRHRPIFGHEALIDQRDRLSCFRMFISDVFLATKKFRSTDSRSTRCLCLVSHRFLVFADWMPTTSGWIKSLSNDEYGPTQVSNAALIGGASVHSQHRLLCATEGFYSIFNFFCLQSRTVRKVNSLLFARRPDTVLDKIALLQRRKAENCSFLYSYE